MKQNNAKEMLQSQKGYLKTPGAQRLLWVRLTWEGISEECNLKRKGEDFQSLGGEVGSRRKAWRQETQALSFNSKQTQNIYVAYNRCKALELM